MKDHLLFILGILCFAPALSVMKQKKSVFFPVIISEDFGPTNSPKERIERRNQLFSKYFKKNWPIVRLTVGQDLAGVSDLSQVRSFAFALNDADSILRSLEEIGKKQNAGKNATNITNPIINITAPVFIIGSTTPRAKPLTSTTPLPLLESRTTTEAPIISRSNTLSVSSTTANPNTGLSTTEDSPSGVSNNGNTIQDQNAQSRLHGKAIVQKFLSSTSEWQPFPRDAIETIHPVFGPLGRLDQNVTSSDTDPLSAITPRSEDRPAQEAPRRKVKPIIIFALTKSKVPSDRSLSSNNRPPILDPTLSSEDTSGSKNDDRGLFRFASQPNVASGTDLTGTATTAAPFIFSSDSNSTVEGVGNASAANFRFSPGDKAWISSDVLSSTFRENISKFALDLSDDDRPRFRFASDKSTNSKTPEPKNKLSTRFSTNTSISFSSDPKDSSSVGTNLPSASSNNDTSSEFSNRALFINNNSVNNKNSTFSAIAEHINSTQRFRFQSDSPVNITSRTVLKFNSRDNELPEAEVNLMSERMRPQSGGKVLNKAANPDGTVLSAEDEIFDPHLEHILTPETRFQFTSPRPSNSSVATIFRIASDNARTPLPRKVKIFRKTRPRTTTERPNNQLQDSSNLSIQDDLDSSLKIFTIFPPTHIIPASRSGKEDSSDSFSSASSKGPSFHKHNPRLLSNFLKVNTSSRVNLKNHQPSSDDLSLVPSTVLVPPPALLHTPPSPEVPTSKRPKTKSRRRGSKAKIFRLEPEAQFSKHVSSAAPRFGFPFSESTSFKTPTSKKSSSRKGRTSVRGLPHKRGAIPGIPGTDYPTYNKPPITTFSCKRSHRQGIFVDPEARCQVFHICLGNGRGHPMLCPNGTLFNQQYLVCDWWFNVECGT